MEQFTSLGLKSRPRATAAEAYGASSVQTVPSDLGWRCDRSLDASDRCCMNQSRILNRPIICKGFQEVRRGFVQRVWRAIMS